MEEGSSDEEGHSETGSDSDESADDDDNPDQDIKPKLETAVEEGDQNAEPEAESSDDEETADQNVDPVLNEGENPFPLDEEALLQRDMHNAALTEIAELLRQATTKLAQLAVP